MAGAPFSSFKPQHTVRHTFDLVYMVTGDINGVCVFDVVVVLKALKLSALQATCMAAVPLAVKTDDRAPCNILV